MTTDLETWLPCPFCGAAAVEARWSAHRGCSDPTCGAHMANLTIEQWNRRPKVDQPVGYRLIRDDDSHWYVIPAVEANRFHTYVDATSRCEESDADAKYFGACRVDGPHAVVFESWRAPR